MYRSDSRDNRDGGRRGKARPVSTRKNERRTDLKKPADRKGPRPQKKTGDRKPQRKDIYNNNSTNDMADNILAGRNPVMEALKSGRGIDKILIADGAEGSVKQIAGMARDKGLRVQYVNRSALERMAGGMAHQGVVAVVSDFEYCTLDDILAKAEAKGEDPFIVLLDGIEDPHNLGAIIRTADAAGAHGVVIPMNRAVGVTPVAEKSAAGAAAYVPVARVTNIARAIDELKEKNIWITAVDMDGDTYWQSNMRGPIAMVVGSEGKGISRLVREKCDFCVSMPMHGGVNSLNASNAAALMMYEILRQRSVQE